MSTTMGFSYSPNLANRKGDIKKDSSSIPYIPNVSRRKRSLPDVVDSKPIMKKHSVTGTPSVRSGLVLPSPQSKTTREESAKLSDPMDRVFQCMGNVPGREEPSSETEQRLHRELRKRGVEIERLKGLLNSARIDFEKLQQETKDLKLDRAKKKQEGNVKSTSPPVELSGCQRLHQIMVECWEKYKHCGCIVTTTYFSKQLDVWKERVDEEQKLKRECRQLEVASSSVLVKKFIKDDYPANKENTPVPDPRQKIVHKSLQYTEQKLKGECRQSEVASSSHVQVKKISTVKENTPALAGRHRIAHHSLQYTVSSPLQYSAPFQRRDSVMRLPSQSRTPRTPLGVINQKKVGSRGINKKMSLPPLQAQRLLASHGHAAPSARGFHADAALQRLPQQHFSKAASHSTLNSTYWSTGVDNLIS